MSTTLNRVTSSPSPPSAAQLTVDIAKSQLIEESGPSIRQQLFFSLGWDQMPEGLMSGAGINAKYDVHKAWNSLSLIEKIAALYRAQGFQVCCQTLPSLGNVALSLSAYKSRVAALTNGVLTASQISHYVVLRTLLLAETDRNLEKESGSLGQTSGVSIQQPTKEVLEGLHLSLRDLFFVLDEAIRNPEKLARIQTIRPKLNSCLNYYQKYTQQFQAQRRFAPVAKRLEKVIAMLECLQLAIEDPLRFLPVLLSPIQAQAADLVSKNTSLMTYEVQNIDTSVADWLKDFFAVFKHETEDFLNLLESANPGKKERVARIKAKSLEIFRQAQEMNGLFLKGLGALHQFRSLTLSHQQSQQGQLQEIVPKGQEYKRLFDTHHHLMGELKEEIKGLSFHITLANQMLEYPWRFYAGLAAGIATSLTDQPKMLMIVHKKLKELFPPPYNTLETPYATGIDILDVRFRTAYFKLRQEVSESKPVKGVDLPQLLRQLDGLMALSSATFRRPRAYLSHKHTGEMSYEDKIGSLEILQESYARSLQWKSLKEHLSDQKAKKSATFLSEYFSHLALLFAFDCWPQLMRLEKSQMRDIESRENAFFCEYFANIRLSLIHHEASIFFGHFHEQLQKPWLQGDLKKILLQSADEIANALKEMQKQEKAQPEPTPDQFENQLGGFLKRLADLQACYEQSCEKILQAFTESCNQNPALLKHVEELLDNLNIPLVMWEPLFLSPSRGLVRYHMMRSLIAEEKAIKISDTAPKAVERTPAPQKSAPLPPPIGSAETPVQTRPAPQPLLQLEPQPEDLPELIHQLEIVCHSLILFYQGFTTLSGKSGAQLNTRLQDQAARNILDTLQNLRELAGSVESHGDRPTFVQELHLRVAVLLEQAVKLVASEARVELSLEERYPLLLLQAGRECVWQMHAPGRILNLLLEQLKGKKSDIPSLDADQLAFLQKLERTIAISSRYPASSDDAFARLLPSLIKLEGLAPVLQQRLREQYRKTSKEFLKQGLKTCLALFARLETPSAAPLEPDRAQVENAPSLAACEQDPKLENEASETLQAIQRRLERLWLYRLDPLQRHIERLAPVEQTLMARMGTIATVLKNLPLVAGLCRDLLLGPEDPALCLSLCHSSLRQESVLLELAQLLLLTHAPLPSNNPEIHDLWDPGTAIPKRYSHRIDQFAQDLPKALESLQLAADPELITWIQKRSKELAPYLKVNYRYQEQNDAPAPVKNMQLLSLLWKRFEKGELNPAEENLLDHYLKSNQAKESEEKLGGLIISTLRKEVKRPLLETLKRVNQLLELYEIGIRA